MDEASHRAVSDIPPAPQQPPQGGNGPAVASMVMGILSFVLCGPLCSVPAVILGDMSLEKIKEGQMPANARGFAMAGVILGWVNLAIFSLALVFFILRYLFTSEASPA